MNGTDNVIKVTIRVSIMYSLFHTGQMYTVQSPWHYTWHCILVETTLTTLRYKLIFSVRHRRDFFCVLAYFILAKYDVSSVFLSNCDRCAAGIHPQFSWYFIEIKVNFVVNKCKFRSKFENYDFVVIYYEKSWKPKLRIS